MCTTVALWTDTQGGGVGAGAGQLPLPPQPSDRGGLASCPQRVCELASGPPSAPRSGETAALPCTRTAA